jgi:acetoin utilization deacetylase AcuC-like enzyme
MLRLLQSGTVLERARRAWLDLQKSARRAERASVRTARRVRARLGTPGVRIVYHEAYRPPANEIADVRRADKMLVHLAFEGWLDARQVLAPTTLGMHQLMRVHARDYLESLDDPSGVLTAAPGLAPDGPHATDLLGAQRVATGGTAFATRLALRAPGRGPVANLGGGFHHARRERGSGFCIFNDVAVAIEEARADGFRGRVLVVDLDLHHGDGTRSIFADDDRVFTYSVHAEHWDTSPAVANLDVRLGPGVGDATYLAAIDETLGEVFARSRPDLVFYVAGVDVAAGDKLGSWRITPDAIFARDRRVLTLARGLPTVMVTAGGYGMEAWRYTARTLAWLLGGQDAPIPSEAETSLLRFRRLRERLDRRALVDDPGEGDPSFGITEADVFGELLRKRAEPRLLGFYSLYRLEIVVEHYGLAEHFRRRGYPHFLMVLQGEAALAPSVVTYADKSRREVLLELSSKEVVLAPPPSSGDGDEAYRFASIEWLLLQDPRAQPSPDKPLLPGQKHPGLGCLRILIGMLVIACERLELDGLTFVPSQYHVAAQARSLATFYDPSDEGAFLLLEDLVRGRSIAEVTESIAGGKIVDPRTGEPIRWRPARMVIPVSARLRARLASPTYTRTVEAAARRGAADVRGES